MRKLILAALVLLPFAKAARADGFDGQHFQPAVGAAGAFVVERPLVLRHLGFGAGLFLNFSDDAVVLRDGSGQVVATPLQRALGLDLLISLGLFDLMEIGVALPVELVYSGDAVLSTTGQRFEAGPGLGDVRILPKFLFWEGGRPEIHFSIGMAAPISLPSGDPAAFRGTDGVTVEPRLLLAIGGRSWQLTGTSGVLIRKDQHLGTRTLQSAWTYGLAATIGLGDLVDLQGELFGAWVGTSGQSYAETPLELLVGAIFKVHPQWSLYAGAGPGLTNGLGSPDLRIVGGVRFASDLPDNRRFEDSDGDGIINRNDKCPNEPEDVDGFQDDDGCPDPDNDQDGVPDEQDECPDIKGDPPDGCPRGRVVVRHGRVEIIGKILFHTGSAEIQPKSGPLVADLAQAIKDHPELGRIRVEGHTDNVGEPGMNQRLSEARADSVKRALVAHGVPSGRLETVGYGETRPISRNTSAVGRARNRRVEFTVTGQ